MFKVGDIVSNKDSISGNWTNNEFGVFIESKSGYSYYINEEILYEIDEQSKDNSTNFYLSKDKLRGLIVAIYSIRDEQLIEKDKNVSPDCWFKAKIALYAPVNNFYVYLPLDILRKLKF
ncbi:MAG: hypothetical protein E6R13_06405 [Spirochaetes bacterium]|nr:MAG: hypothetical protein E6R13_06405 [Spirochaetota bacterium]